MSKLISTIIAAAVAATSFNAFAGSHAVGAPADPGMVMPAPAVVQQAPMAVPAEAKPMKSMKTKKAGKKASKGKKGTKAKKGMKKSKRAQR
jgi:hypothetical protein